VKKLFYTVIAELPYFEQFTTNKLKLIGELGKNIGLTFLEEENNDTRMGDMTVEDSPGILNVKGKKNGNSREAGCPC
jgi:hypothetical protein